MHIYTYVYLTPRILWRPLRLLLLLLLLDNGPKQNRYFENWVEKILCGCTAVHLVFVCCLFSILPSLPHITSVPFLFYYALEYNLSQEYVRQWWSTLPMLLFYHFTFVSILHLVTLLSLAAPLQTQSSCFKSFMFCYLN